MAETRLKTRIILRNDTTSGWTEVQSTVVLMKGEVGIEFDTENNKTKMKIGDGVKTWSQLDYFGGGGTDVEVKLSEDLSVYTPVGLITTASSTNPVQVGQAGDSIRAVFQKIFVGEDENPIVTIPTITAAINNSNYGCSYAVVKGEKIEPKYTITYANVDGSYEYGSTANKDSTSTGIAAGSSSFQAGSETTTGTITNSSKTQVITGSEVVVNDSTSQSVTGTLTFDKTNLKIARTKLGATATTAKSGSTGTLGSDGKIAENSLSLNNSFTIKSTGTYAATKPTGAITISGQPSGTLEVGTTKTITVTLSQSNPTGYYPYGYKKDSTVSSGNQPAGGELTSLQLKYGTDVITSSTSDIGVAKTQSVTVDNVGSNNGTFTATLGYTFPTDRYPISRNGKEIDTTVADYRIESSYNPTITSKSWSATGVYYPYYLASTSDSLTTVGSTGRTKSTTTACTSTGVDPNPSESAYIWFLLDPDTSGTKTIEYESLGQWYAFNGGTSGPTDVSLTLDSGKVVTYKGYHTIKKAAAGTQKFRIN